MNKRNMGCEYVLLVFAILCFIIVIFLLVNGGEAR